MIIKQNRFTRPSTPALFFSVLVLLPTLATASLSQTKSTSSRPKRAVAAATDAKKKTSPAKKTAARTPAASSKPIAVPRLAAGQTPAQSTSRPVTVTLTPPTESGPRLAQTPTQSPTQTSPSQSTPPAAPSTATVPAPSPPPQQQRPPASGGAQKGAPGKPPAEVIGDDEEVIRVTSNLVVVPVSVTDAKGELVQGLKATDFRLEEEGRAQQVAEVGDPEQVPIELALLIDVSGSVNARFAFEQEAASRFLKEVLKPADKASVYTIGITPKLEQARANADIATRSLLAVQPARGPTAFYDTVIEAARYLAQSSPPRHRRVIVVISDGEDNYSEKIKATVGSTREEQETTSAKVRRQINDRVLQEVQREVQRADAVFYSINPSGQSLRLNDISKYAQDGMAQMAEVTGGSAFVPEELEDLGAVFRQIAAELRSQYLVQYYSNSQAPPGKYLGIKVRVPTRADLRIRARQGYYVPQPK
ncbi:MAG: VWA domain-containing protein [Pyrinomonadaceae bacterium]|nr:VWA domain-containing protein [Pyrinomonadaceae bacterium]